MLSRSPWFALVLFSVALDIFAPAPTCAQRRPPSEAVRLYERARERYDAHDYEGAASLLERAVAIDPESSTLAYNLGRAYEEAGDLVRARAYYQRVIETAPDTSEDHQQSRAGISRLDAGPTTATTTNTTTTTNAVIVTGPAPATVLTPGPNRRTPHGDQRFDAWFFLTLGVGVLAAGGAAAFGMLALVNNDEVSAFVIGRDGEVGTRDNKVVNAINFALISDILTISAAVSLTSTLLLVLLRDGPLTQEDIDRERAQGNLDVHFGLGSVAVSGAF